MKLSRLLTLCASSVLALPLVAHDFWVEPSSFEPDKGAILKVSLKVGDFGIGDAVQRADARIVDFSIHGPGLDKAIVGRDGADPAGMVRLESEGVHVLGYRSNHAHVELEPAKFEGYLRERGLEAVLERRKELGEDGAKAREVYSRCAKSLVRVGNGPSTAFDRMLGYPLELIPEKNPYDLAWVDRDGGKALEPVPVRLFFQGKPLSNALIGALDLDHPKLDDGSLQTPITARTDSEGRATLLLPRGGRWLFAAVHMIRADKIADAEWESFWASLTFDAPQD